MASKASDSHTKLDSGQTDDSTVDLAEGQVQRQHGNIGQSSEKNITELTQESMSKPEQQYVTGLKLQVVVGSVTFVLFLMVLDMSIIVTASLEFFLAFIITS
jgi:hypothetical protein